MSAPSPDPVTVVERRAPRSVGLAGIAFSLLFLGYALLVGARPPSGLTPDGLVNWFETTAKTPVTIATLYVAPFAGIAFLWFLAVVRDRIGRNEDRFLSTVFLGSGLLFVAMFWASAATVASLVAANTYEAAPPLSATTLETMRSLSFSFVFVLAARAAAVFMMVTSTIALRSGVFPRWLDHPRLCHRAGHVAEPVTDAMDRAVVPDLGVPDESHHPERRDRCGSRGQPWIAAGPHTVIDRPEPTAPPEVPPPVVDYDAVGESRWPMVIAVFAVLVLGLVPPARIMIGPIPLFPLAVGILLGVLIVGDPGRIDRRARWLRNVSIALVGVLVFGALAGTAVLVIDLVQGSSLVNEAGPLLVYGAKVWLANNVAFALLFWQMDRGGPAERVHGTTRYPDFVFPQEADPSLAAPGWRPRFIDYLYVAFTSANAFSPTDTMPLTGRAKLAMETQALISFAILTLVLARVVSVFTSGPTT